MTSEIGSPHKAASTGKGWHGSRSEVSEVRPRFRAAHRARSRCEATASPAPCWRSSFKGVLLS